MPNKPFINNYPINLPKRALGITAGALFIAQWRSYHGRPSQSTPSQAIPT